MKLKYVTFVIMVITLIGCDSNNETPDASTTKPVENVVETTIQPTATPESEVIKMSDSLYLAIQELLQTEEELTIDQLEEIEELNLYKSEDTELTSIEGIGYCKNLSSLILPPIEDIAPIGDLINLEKLAVSNYEQVVEEAFSGLVNLKELVYRITTTADLKHLANPDNLELFDCYVDIDIENLPRFDNLRVLIFYKGKNNPDYRARHLIEHLSKTNSIEEIYIGDYDIDIEELISCKSLKKLETDNYGYSLRNFDMLSDFNEFEELNIMDFVLEEEVLEDIGQITNLKKLTLRNCEISDISSLRDLENLEYLNVYGNPITNISVVSNFKNLKYLRIDYCFWSESPTIDISVLQDMEQLEILSIDNYSIEGINVLLELPNLKEVNIEILNYKVNEDVLAQLEAKGVEVR